MRSLSHERDRREIEERLVALQAEDRRQWGLMSVGEMICHVRGAFLTAMGEISSQPVQLPVPRAAIKAMALWAPMPWKRNFQTLPELKVGTEAMRVGFFAADRAEAIEQMRRFLRPEQVRVDHAFFGPMSFEDWMRWAYLHTDHHLRQFGR